MKSFSTDPERCADALPWLTSLLAAYNHNDQAINEVDLHARLKTIDFENVVEAVECARNGVTRPAEIRLYRDWIAANPDTNPLLFAAWFNLGVALAKQNDHAGAVTAYGNAQTLKPDFQPAIINLGLALKALGYRPAPLDDAAWLAGLLAAYTTQATTASQPCTMKMDNIHARLKTIRLEDVIETIEKEGPGRAGLPEVRLYQSWISANLETSPLLYMAWFNLGVALVREGDRAAAIVAYNKVRELQPHFYPAAINLGLALEAMGEKDAALQTWESATQTNEARKALLGQRARLLEESGRLTEAEAILRTSLLTDPAQPDAVQHWLHIRQKICQWPVFAEDIPGLPPAMQLRQAGPLSALALTDDIALQRDITAEWIARKMPSAPVHLASSTGYQHDRIRIGYLSSDFCRHAMSFLIAELFERHDRSRFEVFGYCSTLEDGSDIRQRVIAGFDHHRIIRDMSDEQAARLIRNDEIDILIDLNGLTAHSRLAVLRWRPATVQATYLGFIGPVPVPELDYLLCDDFVIPPEQVAGYSPRPLSIAQSYQANDSKRVMGAQLSRQDVSLPRDRFVLCCFSNHYKITEPMFAAWTSIMRRAENTVLWLTTDNEWSQTNLRNAAARVGVAPERILFADRTSPELYMSRLGLADLFLDTSPYNAGTVASDAIRMRLPLLTLCGASFASRMAGSLLNRIGAYQGITTTLAAYIETGVTLATDTQAYAQYKQRFVGGAWENTVGDITRFTREFEATLEGLGTRYRIAA